MKGSCGDRSLSAERTDMASSSLPLRISQRGDSGRRRMKRRMKRANTIWKAMGKRQDIGLGSR